LLKLVDFLSVADGQSIQILAASNFELGYTTLVLLDLDRFGVWTTSCDQEIFDEITVNLFGHLDSSLEAEYIIGQLKYEYRSHSHRETLIVRTMIIRRSSHEHSDRHTYNI